MRAETVATAARDRGVLKGAGGWEGCEGNVLMTCQLASEVRLHRL